MASDVIFWRELALPVESYLHRESAYSLAEQAVREQADQMGIAYVEPPSFGAPDNLSSEIIREIDTLNTLFYDNYSRRAIDITSARFIQDLLEPCDTEQQLATKVGAVSDFITNANFAMLLTKEEKKRLKDAQRRGSINTLETFLAREAPNYDKSIISDLRNMNKLRQQYPIHSISKGITEAYKSLGIQYPVAEPQVAWRRIRQVLLEVLRGIRTALFPLLATARPLGLSFVLS